jgi:hypothetical protein
VTNVYVNSRVNNGVVVVRKENFLRGRILHERIAPSRNPFQGGGAGGLKILGKPPVLEIKPIRETRLARPDVEIKRVSLPPARLERESRTIKERIVAPTKERSVFRPGNTPAPLRNILKERQLEQWVPPKKAPTPQTIVVPPPAARPNRGEPPVKPAPPAVQNREAQLPAGKHQFKRMAEPPGGAIVAPAPKIVPREFQKGEKEKQDAEELRKKRGERGAE